MTETTPDWLARMQSRELAPASDGAPTEFHGILLYATTIRHADERQSLSGVSAYVETAGQIEKRVTATRVIGGAILAGPAGAIVGAIARKKQDSRELYLMIDGPEYAWAVSVDPRQGAAARSFAAKINTLAKQR